MRYLVVVLLTMLLLPPAQAQQAETYDYYGSNRILIQRGMQAMMMCNGLFTSNRTLDQIYAQELQYYQMPALPPYDGQVTIDEDLRAVAVGGQSTDPIPTMRAAYREGLGCIMLAPDQTFANIDTLPVLDLPPPAGDPATIAWPDGDLVPETALPAAVDAEALAAAADWAFDRETHGHPSQITLSLLVVYKGQIIHEQYAPGIDQTTKTRTWSTAKSIAVTLMGMLVDQGKLDLDAPLGVDWLPKVADADTDPRQAITLRNVLHMSSGLVPVDNRGGCEVTGSCFSYWAGSSSVNGALDRGLIREPGTHWDYENYDTLLGMLAMKQAIGDDQTYLEFPRRALLDKIGMRNTLPGVDRFGDYVMSSQVYTNARDLARFGLLYLNDGVWNGEQLLSEDWIDFVRTPAPSTTERGKFYGGQWWLVPDDRTDIPADAYSTAGNRGQYTVVVPSHDLVIVRRGLDWLPGRHGFSQWNLTREVLKALPKQAWGEKPNAEDAAGDR